MSAAIPATGRYWTTRPLGPADDRGMHALSQLCFGDRADSLDFIRSRYTHCTGPDVHVWAADANGELIGTQAVTLLPFHVAGRETIGGMFTAGMTHPEHRRRGVFRDVVLAAEKFAFENGAAFLFTMPNDESFPSFQHMPTWTCLADRRLRAFPLNVGRLLRDRGWPRWLAAPVGALVDARYSARWTVAPATIREYADLAELARPLDSLAQRCGQRYSGVICRRDAAFLRWRFDENPTFSYRRFVSHAPDGIDGYLVTTTQQRLGTTIVQIVDWLVADAPNVLEGLLAAAARAARDRGAGLLGLIASAGVQAERFAAFGFRAVPGRLAGRSFHTAVCVSPTRPELKPMIADDASWYLTLADFDTI